MLFFNQIPRFATSIPMMSFYRLLFLPRSRDVTLRISESLSQSPFGHILGKDKTISQIPENLFQERKRNLAISVKISWAKSGPFLCISSHLLHFSCFHFLFFSIFSLHNRAFYFFNCSVCLFVYNSCLILG